MEKATLSICASIPIVTIEPLPPVLTEGVLTKASTPPEYSAIAYSETPY